ncbi:hypothetical protein ACWCOV_10055 [Kribbella sp. NPDC002412]
MQGVEIWNQINKSAEVVVWPAVVMLGLILFRTRLGEVVQRLREADTPVGTMRFDPSEQQAANQSIAESAHALVETVRTELAGHGRPPLEGDDLNGVDRHIELRGVEAEVETLIRSSFAAGFELSKLFDANNVQIMEGRTPAPVIQWEAAGPRVVGYELNVPDYIGLADSFAKAAAELDRLGDLQATFDRLVEELNAAIAKCRQEGDVGRIQHLTTALEETIRMRDRLQADLPGLREQSEKLARARIFVPMKRWIQK